MDSEKNSKAPSEEINDTLWSIGWQLGVMGFLAFVFAGTGIYAVDSFYGAAFSLVAIIPWHRGTRHINKNWKDVFDAKIKQAEKAGVDQLNLNQDEVEMHHFISCSGTAAGVVPNRRYRISVLYVGETFFAIYDDAGIDMVNRELIRGSGTKELYYRDINSVDYLPPYFMVQTNSGDNLSYKFSDTDAEIAVKIIRKKLGSAQIHL